MTFVPITFLFSFERIDFLHTQTYRESHPKKKEVKRIRTVESDTKFKFNLVWLMSFLVI